MKFFVGISLSILLLCCFILESLAQKDSNKYLSKPSLASVDYQWSVFSSPVKYNLSQIKMLSSKKGYIAGKYLLEFDGKEWKLSKDQPKVPLISRFFVLDEKNIWVSSDNPDNQSDFLFFNGSEWEVIALPFANQIASMHFINKNIGWLGGDREISAYKNGIWKFLDFPNSLSSIKYIFGNYSSRLWVLALDGTVFHLEDNYWKLHLHNEKVNNMFFLNSEHGYALTENKCFEYINSGWRLHSKFNFKNAVKFLPLENGEIWIIGNDGWIIHYDKSVWKKISPPVKEDFLDIDMLSPSEGWIVGTKGTILHYSDDKTESINNPGLGFNLQKIVPISKEINDEYGVALEDLNNDGLKDLYVVCIFNPNRLYINSSRINKEKDSVSIVSFSEEAVYRNITGIFGDPNSLISTELYLGAGLADIDNDNDRDLYLCNLLGKNKLFLNDGNAYFRNVSEQKYRAAGEGERSNSAIFGDVDNDGDVDLFVTNEYISNHLFLNDGNGYFREVTESVGLKTIGGGMCASFADIDGDDKLDLYVTNWALPNILYRNITENGKVKFIDVTDLSGTGGESHSKSNGIAFADIDNDGDLDLFVANRKTSNRFYLNEGNCLFKDVTSNYFGFDSLLSYGVTFADFDHDGYQDLYLSNIGENILYKNVNGKKFIPITLQTGAQHSGYCTGTAAGDIDNDGDIDLYSANYINGSSVLYVNNLNDNNYITLNIKGTKSCRDAIGTKVWLYNSEDKLIGFREINGGSGYSSYNSTEIHFGVNNGKNNKIVIYFPASRIRKTLNNIQAGTRLEIHEEEGFAALKTLSVNAFYRYISDNEIQIEFFKFSFVLILIFVSSVFGNGRYKWGLKMQVLYHLIILFLYWFQIYLFLNKGWFLSIVLPVSFVTIYLVILHLIYERVVMAKISKQEKQKTRDRIARDLHDDLASTISSSLIYTEALKNSAKNKKSDGMELLTKISSLLSEASDSITDIVWTVSPQHDKLDDLILRLRFLISDNCRANSILFEYNVDLDKKEIKISDEVRRNIFLIFKEAVNNLLKHSNAKKVLFNAALRNGYLKIVLSDDGIGFLSDNKTAIIKGYNLVHGNGIRNMHTRANEIGGKLSIISTPGNGTNIFFSKEMTQMDY